MEKNKWIKVIQTSKYVLIANNCKTKIQSYIAKFIDLLARN